MLGYFGVSTIHGTLTRITGSLTCACDIFACVYTPVASVVSSEDFCSVCTEFDSGEISGRAESLARNGHPSLIINNCAILLCLSAVYGRHVALEYQLYSVSNSAEYQTLLSIKLYLVKLPKTT